MHEQDQVKALAAEIQRMHVAGQYFDIGKGFQALLRRGDHARTRIDADD